MWISEVWQEVEYAFGNCLFPFSYYQWPFGAHHNLLFLQDFLNQAKDQTFFFFHF